MHSLPIPNALKCRSLSPSKPMLMTCSSGDNSIVQQRCLPPSSSASIHLARSFPFMGTNDVRIHPRQMVVDSVLLGVFRSLYRQSISIGIPASAHCFPLQNFIGAEWRHETYPFIHANPQLLLHGHTSGSGLARRGPAAEHGGHDAQTRIHLCPVRPLDLEMREWWQTGRADFVCGTDARRFGDHC
jgi:hypothetical protein